MLQGLRATSVDHSAHISRLSSFSQFSLASSRGQRRRHRVFLPRRAWPTETRLCFYLPRVRPPSLGRWRRIGIVKTGYPYRDNTLLFVVVPRSGKAHFRARYKLHTPLIAAARNLRNNAVITWFSAVVAARAILLPGQTREFITSFLFP